MLTANVFLVIQNYNGDISGQLRGDVLIFATENDATNAGTRVGPGLATELGRIMVNTTKVEGEDPLVTIKAALISKFPAGAVTE